MNKAYYVDKGAYGSYKLIPYDKISWTGQWKTEIIDDEITIYMERTILFLGILPIGKEWVHENEIVIRDENVAIYEC